MRAALVLIDVQNDYLSAGGLMPHRDALCAAIELLMSSFRETAAPVVHVWTTVATDDQRMPHWKAAGLKLCVPGTAGHAPPERLRPLPGESIVHKRFYSAFAHTGLEELLRAAQVDTLVLAGLFLRACVRTTAVDAYSRGFQVVIGDGAVGESDPMHGVVTRQYLATRVARFVGHDEVRRLLGQAVPSNRFAGGAATVLSDVLDGDADTAGEVEKTVDHLSPHTGCELLWRVPVGGRAQVARATRSARHGLAVWRRQSFTDRETLLRKVADRLEQTAPTWAEQIAIETGKPIRDARLEVGFAVELIRSGIRHARGAEPVAGAGWTLRRRPLGVVGVITPWNNALAIPLGKIVPALMHGNCVVWKPAIPGAAIAARVWRLLGECGVHAGVISVVQGDRDTAQCLLEEPGIDGISLTGSSEAGFAAQAVCGRRRIPLQAELGGNNAAIVWADADLDLAARQIALGGFGAAGQRCTANRRAVVEASVYDSFVAALRKAQRELAWGDPRDVTTEVGPVISGAALKRIEGVVERARLAGAKLFVEHEFPKKEASDTGFYHPPTLVCEAADDSEIVQEETFGPVVVVQRAENWARAIGLCNGVRQGLAAAIFSRSEEIQERFLVRARAGILKINASTAGAAGDAPFGGWKVSGVGPPEHGIADIEFYTRQQAVYGTRPGPEST